MTAVEDAAVAGDLTRREHTLLTAVQTIGGAWGSSRANDLFTALSMPRGRSSHQVRRDLARLCELGFLVLVDPRHTDRLYRLNCQMGDAR
ncbi:hypothetical protein OG292_03015 [Streptomyces sp. NBC_01511]|uniref:hypothetical protein n=1 Tax=Streptomyces sp. NBC_01511 TaxID=2903889 RepID=UPI00386818D2